MTERTETDPATASLLLMAEAAQVRHEWDFAAECYAKALDAKPDHRAALFNLSVVSLYRGAFAEALDRLDALDDLLAPEWSDLRLSARYDRALAEWYTGDPTAALRDTRAMALVIAAVLRDPARSDRHPFVATLGAGAISLLAAVAFEAFGLGLSPAGDAAAVAREPRRKRLHGPTDPPWAALIEGERWAAPPTALRLADIARASHPGDARVRYNLAVLGARRLVPGVRTAADEQVRDTALADLQFALDADPPRRAWAERDVKLDPLRTAAPPGTDPLT